MNWPRLNEASARAHEVLARRIRDLADDGRPVPCTGLSLPISEDADDRAVVVEFLCPRCPALVACDAAGRFERFGVWGGLDRSPPRGPYKPRTTTQEANQP